MRQFISGGWGLVEMLISLFISTLLMSLIIGCYAGHKKYYLNLQHQLDVHFELSLVRELLSTSLRRAGFTPCLNINQLDTYDRRNNDKTISALTLNHNQTQSIEINYMNDVFNELLTIPEPNKLLISSHILLKENHPIVIADCSHAEIHKVSRVVKLTNSQAVYLTKPLLFDYNLSAAVGEWLEERWFIKPNHQQRPILYYKHLQTEELSEFVQSLEVNKRLVNGRTVINVSLGYKEQTKQFSVAARSL